MVCVCKVTMRRNLIIVLFAISYIQMAFAERSTRKTSVTPVPMMIDEDDNYVSDACTDDPQSLEVEMDIKCYTQLVVKNKSITVWYHNSTARTCLPYLTANCPVYGPSRAQSRNRFATQRECEVACLPGSSTVTRGPKQKNKQNARGSQPRASAAKSQPCNGLAVTGTCQASVPSWYYDKSTDECAEFNYSGCGGNKNRFASRAECVKQCKGRVRGGAGSATTKTAATGRTETTQSGVSRTSSKRKAKGRSITPAPGPSAGSSKKKMASASTKKTATQIKMSDSSRRRRSAEL